LLVFACVFAGALLGMAARAFLPQHHLAEEAKDVIRLGMALIATMTALVLGLVIATAKSSYDAQDDAVKHSAAKILLLDRVLASYGPETQTVRDLLRQTVAARLNGIWPRNRFEHPTLDAPEAALAGQTIAASILGLSPRNDLQRELRSKALQTASEITETRWLVLAGAGSSVPLPFLIVVVFWLATIFASFGLFAPRNGTVVAVLLLCSLSAAAAIFLILELDGPFEGFIRISSDPLRYALSHLGR
jgi:hypothetical protein